MQRFNRLVFIFGEMKRFNRVPTFGGPYKINLYLYWGNAEVSIGGPYTINCYLYWGNAEV
jgi:hypothetical protein